MTRLPARHLPARRVAVALLSGLGLGLGVVPARAGNISINMTSSAALKEGNLEVALKVTNSGDEAAGSVVPILRLRDKEARGERRESLPPGQALETNLSVPAPEMRVGRWPFRVAVDYADANQYPFQALHVAVVTQGNPSPVKVAIPEIRIPPIASSGAVTMKVKNLAGTAREATVTVFAPEGLEATDGSRTVKLEPWEEKSASVSLVNRTALPGSRYPIFVAVEYDEENTHQALVAHDSVEIQARRTFNARLLFWVVAALVLGWLVVAVWRRPAR